MAAHAAAFRHSWRAAAIGAFFAALLVVSGPAQAAAGAPARPARSPQRAATAPPGGATGQPTSGLRSEADRISAAIASDAGEMQRLGERYVVQAALNRHDELSVAAGRARLATDVRIVHFRRVQLRQAAILAYVGAGGGGALDAVLQSGAGQAQASQTYLDAAAGQLNDDVAALVRAESRRRLDVAAEERAAAAAAVAMRSTEHTRTAVLATLRLERHVLAAVNGQLARLVAQRLAAEERAAAAARQRALAAAEAARTRLLAQQAAARAVAARAAAAALRAASARAARRAAAAAAAKLAAAGKAAAAAPGSTAPPREHVQPAPAPAPAAAGPPTPAGIVQASPSPIPTSLGQDFAGLRSCEAGGIYSMDTGNGYYGAYQFSESTWLGLGESGLPSQAAPAVQDTAAYRLYEQQGWAPWPECAAILGLG